MSDSKETETLTEQGKHIAHNMAEVFDISGQICRPSSPPRFRRARRNMPTP